MKKLVVIGDPIEHSLSLLMWNRAFQALGLENEYVYGALKVKKEELNKFVKKLRSGVFMGANVTIPHKISIIQYLDELTKEAKLIGAVNTLYRENGTITGANTDGLGCFLAFREKGVDIEGKIALILGAGGAARSVAFMLALGGARELIILNRTRKKAEKLSSEIQKKLGTKTRACGLPIKELDVDVVINCTSVGMKGEQEGKSLITGEMLKPEQVVMDIVYNPLETRLLKEARKAGATTIKGVEMLVYQATINFRRWTGKEAPIELMKKTLVECLSR